MVFDWGRECEVEFKGRVSDKDVGFVQKQPVRPPLEIAVDTFLRQIQRQKSIDCHLEHPSKKNKTLFFSYKN
jgi:hypothetical protein